MCSMIISRTKMLRGLQKLRNLSALRKNVATERLASQSENCGRDYSGIDNPSTAPVKLISLSK